MDADWFKKRQKIKGVTVHDIGAALGRDRTIVSRIYSSRQKMTLAEAEVFADLLDEPIAEVLKRAGLADKRTAKAVEIGFSEGDVSPWLPAKSDNRIDRLRRISDLMGAKSGADTWRVQSDSMVLAGILPQDFVLIDTNLADSAQRGDHVLAQIYDLNNGTASSILRRFEPPVLVAASQKPEHSTVHVVDNVNVKILGVVTACWRPARVSERKSA